MRFLTTLCCLAFIAAAASSLAAQETPKEPTKKDLEDVRKKLFGDKTEDRPLSKTEEPKEGVIEEPKVKRDPGVEGPRYSSPSPDGTMLAFALYGDIWTMPIDGGRAMRVTMNEANEIRPFWSPDGTKIVFGSDRSGSWDVYTVDAAGGVPARVTYDSGADIPMGYSPDGKRILIQSTRSGQWRMHSIGLDGGYVKLLTLDDRAQLGSYCAETGLLYYMRANSDSKRKGYRGSANDELFRCKPGQIPEQLTHNDQNERYPNISNDGKTLYFTRETGADGKTFNIFAMDTETLETRQITDLDDDGASYLSLSANGKLASFTWKFRLYTIDLSAEKPTPSLAPVYVIEDTRREATIETLLTNGAENVDVSRDGRLAAFNLGGAIWSVNASGGKARQLTSSGSGDTMPRWSPDGKTIAFYSTRSGNEDLYLMDTNGQNITRLTTNPAGDHFHNWSPDGNYLIYSADLAGSGDSQGRPRRDLWRMEVATRKTVQMTDNAFPSDDPAYSPDGQWIAYDAHPSGNADIWIMRADGSDARKVYGGAGSEESPRFSPNGQLLVFNRASAPGTSEVVVTDINGSGEVSVASGRGGQFSKDGKEIIYTDMKGQIRAVLAPDSLTGGRTIPFMAESKVPQAETFKSAFNEAWNHINTLFYDMEYHKIDWNAMKKKYEPLVTHAKTKMEFYYFMLNMLGELNASHQGIDGSISDIQAKPTGRLGAVLTAEPMNIAPRGSKAPYLRLKVGSVDQGGPLSSQREGTWVREGDYIFGVGRTRFTAETNVAALLEDTVGKDVTLLVGSKDDGSDIRTIVVKPESDLDKRRRDYGHWIMKNKKEAAEKSRNAVSYIHIPAMDGPSLARFQAELGSPQVQRTGALVLDVRNNGGGNIHQQLIDILERREYAINYDKNNKKGRAVAPLTWQKPIVLLINDHSFSDAEVFPHAFQTLKLGTIVGVPTPGAVIGTNDVKLSDGSSFRITRLGFRNLDGTNQEGHGCQPDVLVVETAEDRIKGNDPQLDKAIEIALSKVKRRAASTKKPEATAGEDKPETSNESEKSAYKDDNYWALPQERGVLLD